MDIDFFIPVDSEEISLRPTVHGETKCSIFPLANQFFPMIFKNTFQNWCATRISPRLSRLPIFTSFVTNTTTLSNVFSPSPSITIVLCISNTTFRNVYKTVYENFWNNLTTKRNLLFSGVKYPWHDPWCELALKDGAHIFFIILFKCLILYFGWD